MHSYRSTDDDDSRKRKATDTASDRHTDHGGPQQRVRTKLRTGRIRHAAALLSTALAFSAVGVSTSAPVEAIADGEPAPSSAIDRATVWIPTIGCSGTLVAADLVVSAGHCLNKPFPSPAPHAPFNQDRRAWNDPERPDRFYDLTAQYSNGVTVQVGNVNTSPTFSTKASEYALPGNADIILLRLDSPVPSNAAVPVPVLTDLPGNSDVRPGSWVRRQSFTIAGFGGTETGIVSTVLKQATVRGAAFPCPHRSHGWTHGADLMICVKAVTGIARQGDSGGPLYWTDPDGQRWLAGVYQGIEGEDGGRYTATWYRGGSDYRSRASAPLPNIGSWFDRHIDGTTGFHAFMWSSSTSDHHVNTRYASNPAGLDPHVIVDGVGRYRARFPGLRSYNVDIRRTVSVTAYGGSDAFCKIGDDSTDDEIEVLCFDHDGRPAHSLFSVLSSDLADESTAIISGNSTDLTVRSQQGLSAERTGVGRYTVTTGRRSNPWKYVAVTAAGADNTRCHVRGWSARNATVICQSPNGTPVDSGFHFVATSTEEQSYAWSSRLTGRSTASRQYANVAGQDRLPTIERQFVGGYHVEFPGLPNVAGGNVQVSAYGSTASHCKVRNWTQTAVAVWCFDTDGGRVDSQFTVRYLDPLDTGMRVTTRLSWLRALSSDGCGQHDFVGSLRYTSGAVDSDSFGERAASTREFRGSSSVEVSAISRPGARFVHANLRVTDVDGFFCGSDDDVDLVAGPTVSDLRLRIDLYRHRVEVLDPSPSIQSGFGMLTTSGRHGDEWAVVGLHVDVDRPFVVR